jgi:hypothetical protein
MPGAWLDTITLLGESFHCREAAEGAVNATVAAFANAQAKGQALFILLERGFLSFKKPTEGASAASPA